MISVALQTQDPAVARPAQPKLEAKVANLKVKTAALVASARARLDALSPQQRLSAPPAIWRVPGALTAFRDCANCPQMVVIPAGEFTMVHQPLSSKRRPSTASPSHIPSPPANSKSPLTNGTSA